MAKGGRRRLQSVVDPEAFEVVERLERRRGGSPELLAWRRPGRPATWVDVRSPDIADYLEESAGGEFTARTPARGARRCWPRRPGGVGVDQVGDGQEAAIRVVLRRPAGVVDRYREGTTMAPTLEALGWTGVGYGTTGIRGAFEEAVLDLLDPADEIGVL